MCDMILDIFFLEIRRKNWLFVVGSCYESLNDKLPHPGANELDLLDLLDWICCPMEIVSAWDLFL